MDDVLGTNEPRPCVKSVRSQKTLRDPVAYEGRCKSSLVSCPDISISVA